MQRLYTQLIGMPIFVGDTDHKIGRAADLIVDPDKAHLVALITLKNAAIAPVDLLPYEDGYWEVREPDVMIHPDELLRLRSIPPKRRFLITKRVRTKSGQQLGRVRDLVFDMETLSLVQLFVGKGFLFWISERRIIDWKDILEVKDNAIIVKDRCAKVPETVKAPQKSPA